MIRRMINKYMQLNWRYFEELQRDSQKTLKKGN